MARGWKIGLGLVGGLTVFWVAEDQFLQGLQDRVIHDDEIVAGFLATFDKPISIEMSRSICRKVGSEWGYTYQLCLNAVTSIPQGCPIDGLAVQYLEPASKLSLWDRQYHQEEPIFRTRFAVIDRLGDICWQR